MEHGIIGWLFIIVALIFIFGGSKRLEDLGKGFGGFMREFNKAKNDANKEVQAQVIDAEKPADKDAKKDEPKA
jgi:Sec-independent protein translocase protein TatA